MTETGIYPTEGEPRVWVTAGSAVVKDTIGPNALRESERFINRQDTKLVEAGHFGIDYAEYRRCCKRYLHPEADCEHA